MSQVKLSKANAVTDNARTQMVLGGGGIGQVWGNTSVDEGIATVKLAYELGVCAFDMAPLYGNAEDVLGAAFASGYPADVMVSTKCMVGTIAPEDVRARLEVSLNASCERLGRDFVDIYFLHGYIIEDGWRGGPRADLLDKIAMPESLYRDAVVPELERLVAMGRIGAWGVTAGPAGPTRAALAKGPKPGCVQATVNVLNSSGGMHITGEPSEDPGAVVALANANGVEVMAIRALAAGALTQGLDRDVPPGAPEARDYLRASGFRELAKAWSIDPALLAYRYAFSVSGLGSVVTGAKNRQELRDAVLARDARALSNSEIAAIRASVA